MSETGWIQGTVRTKLAADGTVRDKYLQAETERGLIAVRELFTTRERAEQLGYSETFFSHELDAYCYSKVLGNPEEHRRAFVLVAERKLLPQERMLYDIFGKRDKAIETDSKRGRKPVTERTILDHMGNKFLTMDEECHYWGVDPATFICRMRAGWSLEDALTKTTYCTDHNGEVFSSEEEMCAKWGVNPTTFASRIRDGASLQEALTRTTKCFDHLGQAFHSEVEMCKNWKIDIGTYRMRIANGATVETALTHPVRVHDISCVDHEGREFPTIKAMCAYWGVNRDTYKQRLARGLSVKEALTEKPKRKGRPAVLHHEER